MKRLRRPALPALLKSIGFTLLLASVAVPQTSGAGSKHRRNKHGNKSQPHGTTSFFKDSKDAPATASRHDGGKGHLQEPAPQKRKWSWFGEDVEMPSEPKKIIRGQYHSIDGQPEA
ncbi:MAG: hypothetical protein IPL79_03390 [Myxococcales bacterium]|nr:hypothetical protein [Myxococcales bacterium]